MVVSGVAIAAPDGDPPPRIAFVARGDGANFADALAVGSIAGQLGAPVYTTPATALAPDVATALADYAPELVVITGGEAAVSADVEAQIEAATGLPDDKVVRAAGTNRYATAVEIAGLLDTLGVDGAWLRVDGTAADSDLLDGMDSTAFQPAGSYANADTACPTGQVVIGITADGQPACGSDAVDGGDAQTLDGMDSSAFAGAPVQQTVEHLCAHTDFDPMFLDSTQSLQWIGIAGVGKFRTITTAGSAFGYLSCDVPLPAGATVTGAEVVVFDDVAAADVDISCVVSVHTWEDDTVASTFEAHVLGETSGTPQVVTLDAALPEPIVADVPTAVSLACDVPATTEFRIGVLGGLVTYTVQRVPGTN